MISFCRRSRSCILRRYDGKSEAISVNNKPKSGTNLRVNILKELKNYIDGCGDSVSVNITKTAEEAANLTKSAIADNYDAVMVAGGDGSVRVVLEAAAGSDTPILIIPTGTENLMACELGFDGSLSTMKKALEHGKIRKIDLGKANGRHFMAVVGVGFDAEVVEYVHHKRSGHITPLNYLWPLARTFWSHKFDDIRIEADGNLVCDEPCLAFISNISRYAIGLGIAPDADCSDGYLDLTVYRCRTRWRLLWQSLFTVLKKDDKLKTTTRLKCKSLCLSSKKSIAVHLDGDEGA